VLALACLSSAAMAEKSVSLKAGSATILEESVPMVLLSFGFTKTFSNNFYGGLIYNFGYGSMDLENSETTYSGFSTETETIAVGEFDIFGLVGGAIQSIDNLAGAGFSYGTGVDWKFADNFSVGVEYKQASMELDGVVQYDYDLASANISYRW
jgi:long-subunit fatty acid transport protein